MLLKEQQKGTTSAKPSSTPTEFPFSSTTSNAALFETDEKKQLFKSALRQENRQQKLKEAVGHAPKLELNVRAANKLASS